MKTTSREPNGFTLVEVVVAMVILSTVLVTLAGLSYQTARRSLATQGLDQRQSVMMQEVNRMVVVSYDSINQMVGCSQVSGAFAYTRCITTSTPATNITRIQVVVTPARTAWKPDTMTVDRTKTPRNPLNTGL